MPKLPDQVRACLRVRHYSYRTEQAYARWIKRFNLFHHKRHPGEMGAPEVTAFLSHLATERRVAASTPNQALSAPLFLYRVVLGRELPWLTGVQRAKRPVHVMVVLTREEVSTLLSRLTDTRWLMASLLYGAGLHLSECLRLRVRDLDFGYLRVVVRGGKGAKDRFTVLPEPLVEPPGGHLVAVKRPHEKVLAAGYGCLELPRALARK